jgi:hypothetical protein
MGEIENHASDPHQEENNPQTVDDSSFVFHDAVEQHRDQKKKRVVPEGLGIVSLTQLKICPGHAAAGTRNPSEIIEETDAPVTQRLTEKAQKHQGCTQDQYDACGMFSEI